MRAGSTLPPFIVVMLLVGCGGCAEEEAHRAIDAGIQETDEREQRAPLSVERSCDPPRPADARVPDPESDIVYATMNGEALRLDLLRPPGAGPHPTVVLIHGGAWTHGNEDWMARAARALTSRGWAAASVQYRLVDGRAHTFPGPIADVRCAVRWLRAHAAERNLDPDRMVAWGGSAGGHLAALLATASDVGELDGECEDRETSPAVQGAISFYAPHDLRPSAEWRSPAESVIADLLGGPREDWPDRAALASPIAHVDRGDPPMVLAHGTDDPVVEITQSRRMRDRLREAGVPVALIEVEGAEHGFGMLSRERSELPAVCTSLALLDRVRQGQAGN